MYVNEISNGRHPGDLTPESAHTLLFQLAGSFFSHGAPTSDLFPPKQKPPAPPDATARYRTLVEQIPAVIFMAFIDQGLSEAYVSPYVETTLGFTQQQWLNDPVRWFHQIHPDDRTRWSTEAAQFIVSGQPLRSVYRVLARDGHVVWFDCQVKLVLTEDGRPWFLHGAAFDITDLKQAQSSLQQAHDELDARVRDRTIELQQLNHHLQQEVTERRRAEAALAQTVNELTRTNADLRQFAYSASHDLQEPLRNMANYSQWLKARYQGKLDATADKFLHFLSEGAQRMIAMVRDLLEYTRMADEIKDKAGITDAGVTLNKVTADLHQLIHETLAVLTHDSLPLLAISEVHLRQLFQNLIANAIKYRSDLPPRLHLSATCADSYCTLALADNGVGIAPEFHEKIFGIFTRLDQRDDASGTGIGLAICKRITEQYGGRIWVDSQPNRGSTFYFKLPLPDSAG